MVGGGPGLPWPLREPGQPRPRAPRPSGKTLAHGTRTPVPRSRTSPTAGLRPQNLSPPTPPTLPPCSVVSGQEGGEGAALPKEQRPGNHRSCCTMGCGPWAESGPRRSSKGPGPRGLWDETEGWGAWVHEEGTREQEGMARGPDLAPGEMWFLAPASPNSAGLSPPLGLRPVAGPRGTTATKGCLRTEQLLERHKFYSQNTGGGHLA